VFLPCSESSFLLSKIEKEGKLRTLQEKEEKKRKEGPLWSLFLSTFVVNIHFLLSEKFMFDEKKFITLN